MKVYRVGYLYTEGGYVEVEAENAGHAATKVLNSLESGGLDNIAKNPRYSTSLRSYEIDDVERVVLP